jgi:mevalonate kinase
MLTNSLTDYERVNHSDVMSFYSNGKLLLTGEYLVLDGAIALALPLKVGQKMEIEHHKNTEQIINWNVDDINGEWFHASIKYEKVFSLIHSNNQNLGKKLIEIFSMVKQLNPHFFSGFEKYTVHNKISFDRNWGLGTSSTFISNLSSWANVNPYKLNNLANSGSGYDIACAHADSPLLFNLINGTPKIHPVSFSPPFRDHIYFIYLGHKQDTSLGISYYRNSCRFTNKEIESINEITKAIVKVNTIKDFIDLLREHEKILATVLKNQTIQQKAFSDFNGVVKSLGSWGGDFVLAATENSIDYAIGYFKNKGYSTIFGWDELVLKATTNYDS